MDTDINLMGKLCTSTETWTLPSSQTNMDFKHSISSRISIAHPRLPDPHNECPYQIQIPMQVLQQQARRSNCYLDWKAKFYASCSNVEPNLPLSRLCSQRSYSCRLPSLCACRPTCLRSCSLLLRQLHIVDNVF